MSLTTLLSNVPNLLKVVSLSAAVGTGGAALALQDAPLSPMDTTPVVSASAPAVSLEESPEPLLADPSLELATSDAMMEMMAASETDDGEAAERGPKHATGLDRAEERANAHAAHGHARARAAHAANAAHRAERGEPGSRGSEEARASRAAERDEARASRAERAESREASGRAIAASKREGRGRH